MVSVCSHMCVNTTPSRKNISRDLREADVSSHQSGGDNRDLLKLNYVHQTESEETSRAVELWDVSVQEDLSGLGEELWNHGKVSVQVRSSDPVQHGSQSGSYVHQGPAAQVWKNVLEQELKF